MPVEIKLSWEEVTLVGIASLTRMVMNLEQKRPSRYGFDKYDFGLDKDFMGCLGEYALTKYIDRNWAPFDRGSIDVGGMFEVRASGLPYLCLHEQDRDIPFVSALVTRDKLPVITLMGWMHASVGKTSYFWSDKFKNGRPAFWVPHGTLYPMEELPAGGQGDEW